MMHVVKKWALAGAVVPCLVMMIAYCEVFLDPVKIPYATRYGRYVWPSWILMLGSPEEFTFGGALGLSISIAINAFIYSTIGVLVWLARRVLLNRQGKIRGITH